MIETKSLEAGKSTVFRHELKYIIGYHEKERLKCRLSGLMQQDQNAIQKGYYRIRSLYFDDIWNSAYEDKLAGVGNRHKFRIRMYPDGDNSIHLEKKTKCGDYVAKQDAALSVDETEKLVRGDYQFLLQRGEHLCHEFYHACTTGLLRPRVIVDYEREPFVFQAGDVRITFDSNVRAGVWGFDMFDDRLPMTGALDPGWLILEIKYTELLPNFIRSALPTLTNPRVSVSKYVLACDKTRFAAR